MWPYMLSHNQEIAGVPRYGPWFKPHINTWMFGRTSIGSSLFYSLISSSWEIKLFNNHILFDVIILSILILLTKKILCLFGFYFFSRLSFYLLFIFSMLSFYLLFIFFYVIFLCVLFLFLCVFLLFLFLFLLQLLHLLFLLIPMSYCILSCRVV